MKTAATAFALAVATTLLSAQSAPAAKGFPPYESGSFVAEVSERATGFFRVVKRDDGRWWVIDPLGRGFVPMGVDLVRSCGFKNRLTGKSAYGEHVAQEFPDIRDWEKRTLDRLKSWGFNLLGARSDRTLEHRGLAHTMSLLMGSRYCHFPHFKARPG